jgi:hypothetical protein
VAGDVLDGSQAGQFQQVPFEGVGVAAPLIREAELDLAGPAAVETAKALDGQLQNDRREPMGRVRNRRGTLPDFSARVEPQWEQRRDRASCSMPNQTRLFSNRVQTKR